MNPVQALQYMLNITERQALLRQERANVDEAVQIIAKALGLNVEAKPEANAEPKEPAQDTIPTSETTEAA